MCRRVDSKPFQRPKLCECAGLFLRKHPNLTLCHFSVRLLVDTNIDNRISRRGFFGVPRVVGALPGEYRVRLVRIPLVESLLEVGVTPLPTALPAPSIVSRQPNVTIPALESPTATATSEPITTQESEEACAAQESVEPTMTPTAMPSPGLTWVPA